MTLHPGTVLADRYEVGDRLGARADTCTYAAVDRQGGQPVVVKELALSGLEEWKPYDLFEREARILANLDHPQIPRLVAYFQQEDEEDLLLYLVAARVPGRSLAARLEEGWRPQEAEVRAIARRVLAVLVYLQGLQPPVIHRDIKPSNLVMDDAGEICLVDFGSVRDAVRPQGGSTVAGTFGYMAPEQFIAQAVPASDLYGLGVTLVHLLSGVPPEQIPQRELRLNFRPLVSCSAALAAWIVRLLEPAAEGRFSGAAEARRVLDRLDAGELSADDLLQRPDAAGESAADGTRKPSRREAISATMLWVLTGGIGGATVGVMLDQDVFNYIGTAFLSLMNFGPLRGGYERPLDSGMSAVLADGTGRAIIGAGAGVLLGAIGVLSPKGIVRTVIERVVGIMFGVTAGALVGAVGGAAAGMLLGLLFGLPLGPSGWLGGPLFGAYFGVVLGAVAGAIAGVVLGAIGGVSRIAAILQALFEGKVASGTAITSGRDNP